MLDTVYRFGQKLDFCILLYSIPVCYSNESDESINICIVYLDYKTMTQEDFFRISSCNRAQSNVQEMMHPCRGLLFSRADQPCLRVIQFGRTQRKKRETMLKQKPIHAFQCMRTIMQEKVGAVGKVF